MGRILVVDDEKSIRVTLKAFLEAAGNEVETAEDAESALSVLETTSTDVVLTDIILPKVSGVDLLKRIRRTWPLVQVVMMTGEPTLETASESLRLGAVDYLQKPVGKNDVLKTIRNALRVKRLSDEKLRLEQDNQNHMHRLEQLVQERTLALAASEGALRRRAEELSILNRISRKVNESITVQDTIQFALDEIVNASTADFAAFFQRADTELTLEGMAPEEYEDLWKPRDIHMVGNCLCGLAAEHGRAVYSSEVALDVRCTMGECIKVGFVSCAALPLSSDSENTGVLVIASVEKRDFHLQASFLEAIAAEVSIGLKKSLLYEQVQRHALELQTGLNRIKESEAERRKLEEHLQRSQRMEALGVLAGGIAHDFNNILGAVIGYAELALMGLEDNEKSRKNIKMVLTAGERARELVKHILAFSRQSEKNRKPVQIAHIVKEVAKFIRASLPTTITIRQYIDSDIPNVMADPVQMHQVLMNLCTNAHHAMREKGGILEIRLQAVDLGSQCASANPGLEPGPYVKLTIKDTGHGMDEETRKKIFEPYFTTKAKGVGTGLGLAVAHSIVEKHEGMITLESEPEKGAEFGLYFPAIAEESTEQSGLPEMAPTGNERILFIDDEQFIVDIGKEMLEELGYSVEARTSSTEALSLFKNRPDRFDLVVADVTMPKIAGDDLAVKLKEIRADIPIVLCTGYSERIDEKRAKAIGIQALVMKPVLRAEMANAIRKALDS